MKRRIWKVAAAFTSVAALVAVPSAYAAYTSAKLEVVQAGTAITLKATLSPDDDPTARVRFFVPAGTQLTTTQAPGTVLGTTRAVVKALDLAGADLPLEGQLIVAAPGQVAPTAQAACLGATTPVATWVMVLSAAGQTLPVPAYLVATAGAQAALGPAYIQICLPPPDVPVGTPSRATFGAKVYTAQLTIGGVFSGGTGAWIAFWTPYRPNVGQVNVAGTIASPASVAPGAVTIIAARKSGKRGVGAVVTGRVTQGGQARAGATVTIFAGPKANRLKRLGRMRTTASGAFTFRAKSGLYFRANAAAAAGAAPAACSAISAAIAPVPCVNPTTSGFTAQSRVIRKR
ncbi:MAG: hypothetical protein M3364_07180 [Actinomycetota bacterium]|nr:hypothetical protein [Actinomycetota bacterium]